MGETVLGNRYEIIKKIGDGGMAFVYKAKDILLNRIVAVKVLRPEFVDDDEFLGKFKREAEAVASLSHPNIVNVYDVGEDGKVHYIVMEYIDGQNLKEIIKNEGTLDEYTALDITKQIAMALSAAHKKGIIHRDIKPHNILISNEGRVVKVADFGIAKAVSNSTMTNIGSIIGSVHYFSPEQAKGKFVSNNADLYSLGIVLYEMIIGKVPFRGDSPISIALQHINDEIEFTSEEQINIPQSVRTIIKKLTEKSSVDRYQSAEEVIEDIEYIEKNIDLDFIKEYDNYVTKNIDIKDLNKQINIEKNRHAEDVVYDDEDDDDYYEEEKPKYKKKQKNKKSPNKSRKRLKIALTILILILATQIFIFAKFFLGGPGNKEGQISAPDLYNLTLDEAQRSLDKLNLNIRVNIEDEYSNEVEKGKIISQQPMSGATLQEGDTVTLVLSKGPMKGYIPNVVGLTLGEAENILKENKLSLGNIKYEYSDTYNNGIVISQDPKSGSENNQEWGTVNVVVSKGKKEEVVQPPEEDDEEEEVQPPNVAPINPGSPNSGNQNGSNDNQSQDSNTGVNNNQPGQGNGEQDTETDAGGIIEPPQTEVPQSQEN
ncbi:MAG: Stk1 family PASTA domain-containing Ser/Thr kinase [Romboutsia timonensis]|uniref:Stk1 family PASTA domain-containing Ser/Thr kinase n=1 Tax=Romboutsia timonensis TaxID=1776391 RepID=UPI002A74AF37|nr:Stk1 family PASTA domain-containing Ser/Thr kinase [Romboutsia timonensis]MDY2881841.1 Stk1 family PASTA domain-containing Ser/Thr kinase [Romboutsia timonensis]